MRRTTHEAFSSEETVTGGSDRSFGILMTATFVVMSLFEWWHDRYLWRWTAGIAALFLASALVYPAALKPLHRLWLKLGLLLHKIMTPIMMAFVFFGTVLPTGLIMRALGKDLLRLKRKLDVNSYWIERCPPGPAPKSMKDQF